MSADHVARLDALSKGFRARYLRHDDLTAQMRAWCEAFPHLARMQSLGSTPEGRPLWLLTLGPDADRTRPSVWVDGNMHAGEYAGSSVALAIAEDILRLHLDPAATLHGLTPAVCDILREVRVFVMPRMSPDGAEAVLSTGRYVRSVPRDTRNAPLLPRWRHHDLDGDGLALVMRQEDPSGEFVESDDFAGLLVPRRLEDPGPYYKIYPEGTIEGWDGHTIPSPFYLQEYDVDLNRNFPFGWAPEERQLGAGRYAASEPESRAVVDFVSAHPEIFAWLNLHTFGGVFIRPMGDKPDTKMPAEDLAVWRQVGQWAEQCTGYPVVSGFEEFLYEPDTPLRGDLVDYGYAQRGAITYVCELWDLFQQLGIARKKPFVDHYSRFVREDYVTLARWDHAHNASRIVRPWHPFVHPQLGPVEIGGLDPRVGIWNPPYDRPSSPSIRGPRARRRSCSTPAPRCSAGRRCPCRSTSRARAWWSTTATRSGTTVLEAIAGRWRRAGHQRRHRRHRDHQPARDHAAVAPRHGRPLHRAIVWQDRRTADAARPCGPRRRAAGVRARGAAARPVFLGHEDRVVARPRRGRAGAGGARRAGLRHHRQLGVHKLTGGAHVTDVSNASRTMLFGLERLAWDDELLAALDVPRRSCPRWCRAPGVVGVTRGVPGLPDGIPIAGIAGDQQAALFGQGCFARGDVKCTYGTGAFVLMNVGAEPVPSKHRLLNGGVADPGRGGLRAGGQRVHRRVPRCSGCATGSGSSREASEIEALARSGPTRARWCSCPRSRASGRRTGRPGAGAHRGPRPRHDAGAPRARHARRHRLEIADLVEAMSPDAGRPSRRCASTAAPRPTTCCCRFRPTCGHPVVRPKGARDHGPRGGHARRAGAGLVPNRGRFAGTLPVERTFDPRCWRPRPTPLRRAMARRGGVGR
jgi:hypothetical protein